MIKQKMDEKFGGAGYWNVVVGESFDVRKEDILHIKIIFNRVGLSD